MDIIDQITHLISKDNSLLYYYIIKTYGFFKLRILILQYETSTCNDLVFMELLTKVSLYDLKYYINEYENIVNLIENKRQNVNLNSLNQNNQQPTPSQTHKANDNDSLITELYESSRYSPEDTHNYLCIHKHKCFCFLRQSCINDCSCILCPNQRPDLLKYKKEHINELVNAHKTVHLHAYKNMHEFTEKCKVPHCPFR